MSTEGRLFAGKFRILDEIAQGDLASVYQAIDSESGSVCTLKLFNWDLSSNGSFLNVLKQEAVNIEKLRHPNIMPVGRVDQTQKGQVYAVREFIEGRNLEDVIRLEAPLGLLRACAIGRQIASALEASHNVGILHGDLKPSNVLLVDEEGGGEAVKVLGFGTFPLKQDRFMDLARLAINEPGQLLGSAQYISPERAIGTEPDALDGRSDLYSLGVILYEMLCAETPFRGSNAMEILLDHLFDEPQPLVKHPDLEIPEVLDTLVMRTLARNRKDRPSSATVLVDQLQAWQQYQGAAQTRVAAEAEAEKEEEPIPAGKTPDRDLLPQSRFPFIDARQPPPEEAAPAIQSPIRANADESPERLNPEPESSVLPVSGLEGVHDAVSSEPQQASDAGVNLEVDSLSAPNESAAEPEPVSRLPFAQAPNAQSEEFAPTVQLPVRDTVIKMTEADTARPESPWPLSAATASEPTSPAPDIDFPAPAAETRPSIALDQQGEPVPPARSLANWQLQRPATDFPPSTGRKGEPDLPQVEPSSSSFTPELSLSHPDQIGEGQESVGSTPRLEGQTPAPQAFVADLEAPPPLPAAGTPIGAIADVTFESKAPSKISSSAAHPDVSKGVSAYVSSQIDWAPPAPGPARRQLRGLATILVILIACALGSGWLYYTGRSYWFQPQYVISRVSSLVFSKSSGPTQSVQPAGSAPSPSLSTNASSPPAKPVQPPSSAAPVPSNRAPQPASSQGSATVTERNRPVDALKAPSVPQALKRLPVSEPPAKPRMTPQQNEGAAAVEDAIRRGNYYFLLGQYDSALRVYRRALKQSPGNPRVLERIARAKRAKAAEAEFLGH